MTLTNQKLITLVTSLGEEKTHALLVKKIEDDEYRREYHRKYNVKKSAIEKVMREKHPELYEAAKAAVN
jgi:hypothetical protein